MASGDATAIPVKNQAYRCVFPILDADGDLVTGATGLDSEVSKDQGTFADATSEATEIATSSGIYYLDLTATEMNADCVAVIVKTSSSGAKTTVLVFYPQEAGDINVDVTYWNGTAVATPTTGGVPEVDVTHWLGTAAATPTVAGVPEVDLTHVGGATTNVAALATNVDAILTDTSTTLDNLVDDLESRLGTPSDLGSGATLAANMSDVNDVNNANASYLGVLDNYLKVLSQPPLTIGSTGNDTTHIHLAGLTYGDDEINNMLIVIYDDSANEYHSRWVTDWVLSTELATVATLPFTPQNATDKVWLLPVRNDVTASGDSSGVTTLLSRIGTPSDLGGGATVAANLADIEAQTDDIGVAGAGLTVLATQASVNTIDDLLDTEIGALTTAVADLPTNAELATALGTADDAVLAAIAALNNLSSSAAATAVLTTAITESYAADGAAPTLAQFISLVIAMLSEFSISGTTLTAKKLDGSTTAATFTLDSATTPTSITRAT